MGRIQEHGPGGAVTAGPWGTRDSFVAETAISLDRLAAKIERLERREEALRAEVAELAEHAAHANRLHALAESLRNSRDFKLDEMSRTMKSVRSRLDAIEGPRAEFNGLACKSFITVDRRLAELAAIGAREARLAWRAHAGIALAGVLAILLLATAGGFTA
ncbi:hypothetical protein [Hyphomicrobium sp.]|uniref:hypothetical protein n=1 Tax=Hyphomicrobium sp. TaxID=82 RepID=UPI002FDDE19C